MSARPPLVRPRWQTLLRSGVMLLALSGCDAWSQWHEAAPAVLPAIQGADPLASAPGSDTVVLAGGCFWGMQAVFQHVHGVQRAISGYAGGEARTAQYESVGSGQTGHAESVQLTFDPSQVSLAELLRIYFSVAHDPTQVNRQGPDQGSQYRSAIFYHDEHQALLARRYVAQLENGHYFGAPIATQIAPLKGFYAAEAYHQDYATLHPESGYIARFDLPKLEHLKRLFPQDWRDKPALVSQH